MSHHPHNLRSAAEAYAADSPMLADVLKGAAHHIEWLEALLSDAKKRTGMSDLEIQLRASVAMLGEGAMKKHTPGPWEIVTNDLTPYLQLIGDYTASRKSMGKLAKGYATSEADARLIAAAPDLLEALKQCQEFLMDTCRPMRTGDNVASSLARGLAIEASARAAISKATGAH
jgi:hypothetical protein